jgi:hypothetical protein
MLGVPLSVRLLCIAWICSLYLVLNILPVWPIYFFGHSRQFNWQMPLLLQMLSVVIDSFGCKMCSVVFYVL